MDFETDDRVSRAIAHGYQFKLGTYINEGFGIVSSNIWIYMGFLIVSIAIVGIAGSIPYVGFLARIFLSPALGVGYFIVADKIRYDNDRDFSNFFNGFKQNYIQLVLGYFVSSLIIVAPMAIGIGISLIVNRNLITALDWTVIQTNPRIIFDIYMAVLPYIALFLPITLYFAVSYFFHSQLIYFKGYDFWRAMETSRKVIGKKWFSFLLFFIVLILLNLLGFLCLIIGLLFTIPATVVAGYAAFDDILGTREAVNEDDLTGHLITPSGGEYR